MRGSAPRGLEKPKASCSAFVFFAKERRKQLQEEHPAESFQEVSARLGRLWNELPEEEREYYDELSLMDKARFKEEKRRYKERIMEAIMEGIIAGTVQPNSIDQATLSAKSSAKTAERIFDRFSRAMADPALRQSAMEWNSLSEFQKMPFYMMEEESRENSRMEQQCREELLALIENSKMNQEK